MSDSVAVKNLNLEEAGLTSWKEVYHNLSYDELFEHEMDPSLEGCEKNPPPRKMFGGRPPIQKAPTISLSI